MIPSTSILCRIKMTCAAFFSATARHTPLAVTALLVIGGSICAAPAQAALVSVSCPGTAATTDREFTLTTDPGSTCFAFGTGNLSGNPGGANPDPFLVANPGYVLLDKTDDATSGALPQSLTSTPPTSGLSGTFSINAPGFFDFIVALKSGEGQLDPDWAAFRLPAGVISGEWAISGAQALSHMNLYAQVVPLPAALPLLLTGLIGFGLVARRRRGLGASATA